MPAVVAGAGEAVFASQLAVLGDQQAHRLDRGGDHPVGELGVIVLRKEEAVLIHLVKFAVGLDEGFPSELPFKGGEGRFGAGFAHRRGDVVEKLIGGLVDDRNAAAVDIEDDIKAV